MVAGALSRKYEAKNECYRLTVVAPKQVTEIIASYGGYEEA